MEVENAQHVWHSYDDDRWKAGAGTTALGMKCLLKKFKNL